MIQPWSPENGSIVDISGNYLPTCKAFDVAWIVKPGGQVYFYDIEHDRRLSFVNDDGAVEFVDARDGMIHVSDEKVNLI